MRIKEKIENPKITENPDAAKIEFLKSKLDKLQKCRFRRNSIAASIKRSGSNPDYQAELDSIRDAEKRIVEECCDKLQVSQSGDLKADVKYIRGLIQRLARIDDVQKFGWSDGDSIYFRNLPGNIRRILPNGTITISLRNGKVYTVRADALRKDDK